MRYLVISNGNDPFYTNWFDAENHFNKEIEMVVFDLVHHIYTADGKIWEPIKEDHL